MQLNELENGLVFVGGAAFTYRCVTPDERPNCGQYLLCRYATGQPVHHVTPKMQKRVSEDVAYRNQEVTT